MTTKIRKVRVPDDLWEKYQAKCSNEGTTVSEDIRNYIYNKVKYESESNTHIYQLVEDTYHKSGRVPLDLIERNTNPVQYQEVIKYCKDKGYHLTVQTEDVKEWDGKYSLWD